MIRVLRIAALAALMVAGAASGAMADLNSATYVSGKAAYAKGDYPTAKQLLTQYLNEDAEYLKSNPDVVKNVQAAIRYCSTLISVSHMIVAAQVVLPPKPTLK